MARTIGIAFPPSPGDQESESEVQVSVWEAFLLGLQLAAFLLYSQTAFSIVTKRERRESEKEGEKDGEGGIEEGEGGKEARVHLHPLTRMLLILQKAPPF